MRRVSQKLARGIFLAVLLVAGGRLSSSTPSSLERARGFIRSQNFSPTFQLAGDRIEGYFRSRDIEGFIDEVFSLGGKWKAVTWRQASYEEYIGEAVERHLVSTREVNDLLERIRGDFRFALEASHNRLITVLYTEVRRERPRLPLGEFRATFKGLASELAPSVLDDLGMNVTSIVGAEAAVMITAAAMSSSTIMGSSAAVGAAAGPWTFGTGLVVGITVGMIIDSVAGAESEDAARAQIRKELNLLRNRLFHEVDGALIKGFVAHLGLQEACARSLCQGGRHGAPAFDR